MGGISRLRLRHFRNYGDQEVEFAPGGLQVLCGPNGQGKTNLLEAVYYLSLLRSFRSSQIASLPEWKSQGFYLEASVETAEGGAPSQRLEVVYSKRRNLRLDGREIHRASDFINQYLCVALVPEDIQLVKGAASERRRFVDIAVSQLDPLYLHNLQRFQLCLKSRNAMLRQPGRFDCGVLAAYDRFLVDCGCQIVRRRRLYCQQLNERLQGMLSLFHDEQGLEVTVSYQSALLKAGAEEGTPDQLECVYSDLLQRHLARDREDGYTRIGPHRDTIRMSFNGKCFDTYGSEGQCRLMSLALRLASLQLTLGRTQQSRPVILLVDDVFGELDPARRRQFFQSLRGADQIIVACTEVPEELTEELAGLYRVENGTVRLAP